ncbi:MAG: helix-turn-helix domain-containing protein [Lewinellaceae bacterium]|nr:helix-turn-helix domain-containing protein [Lewinellaceae bacterium]
MLNSQINTASLTEPFTFKSMDLIEKQHPSRHERPHRHDYFSLIFVEKAIGEHRIDFQTYPLHDNTLFFLSPGQVHYLRVHEGIPQGSVLLFTPDFLEQYSLSQERLWALGLFFDCNIVPPLTLPENAAVELKKWIHYIRDEYTERRPNWLEMIGQLLHLLLITAVRCKVELEQENQELGTRKSNIVQQFKKDLEQNFTKWHKVAQYGAAQNLTPNYLNEIIKSETGVSAKDHIQNRLMLEAKRLAIYSSLSTQEVGWHLGFKDHTHFSRFFKKGHGQSFSVFKNELNGNHHP